MRTSAANWLLRLLGAKIGRNVMLDSLNIYDPDVVEIGNDVTLDKGSSIRGCFVVSWALLLLLLPAGRICCHCCSAKMSLGGLHIFQGDNCPSRHVSRRLLARRPLQA